MRKVATFEKVEEANLLLSHLEKQKISCHIEEENGAYELWVLNEDQLPFVRQIIADYRQHGIKETTNDSDDIANAPQETVKAPQETANAFGEKPNTHQTIKPVDLSHPPKVPVIKQFGGITRAILLICAIIFGISIYQKAQLADAVPGKQAFSVFTPLNQWMLYDYPPTMAVIEQFVDLRLQKQENKPSTENEVASSDQLASGNILDIPSKKDLTPEEQKLLDQIQAIPVWAGVYNLLLHYKSYDELLRAPLFTSIRQGEVWRLVSPVLLHANLLHFLFNMLWLWLLGRMVEENMGFIKYLAFILIIGVVTNTLQYLMTGPFFMGISGVLTGMAGYIWVRKKRAPWEVFPIDKSTLLFLTIFVFGLFGLQIIAFYLQLVHNIGFPLSFANTAHVSGILLGGGLGMTKIFQRKI